MFLRPGGSRFEQLYSHVKDPNLLSGVVGAMINPTTNANINLGVSCAAVGFTQNSLGAAPEAAAVLRTTMMDNAGTYASFDTSMTEDWGTRTSTISGNVYDRQLNTGRNGGTVVGQWNHVALIVDGDKMSVALNGYRQGQSPRTTPDAPRVGVASADMLPQNTLWVNGAASLPMTAPYDWTINPLPTPFTGFDFGDSDAMLGATPGAGGGSVAGFFTGGMAGVAIYRTAVDLNGLRCLYAWGETALAVDKIDVAVPITDLMGDIVDGCVGVRHSTLSNSAAND